MKRIIMLCSLCFCIGISNAKAWDFAEPNQDGDTIYYNIEYGNAIFDGWNTFAEDCRYKTDTFRIPETVEHNGITYKTGWRFIGNNGQLAFLLGATKASPQYVYIPKTLFTDIKDNYSYKIFLMPVYNPYFSGYIVDKEHPLLTSDDGVIFSKEKDSLLFFPTEQRGTYNVPKYVKYVDQYAFVATSLDSLVFSDYFDVQFGYNFIEQARFMKSFRFPNATRSLPNGIGISGEQLEEIILGSDLQYIGGLYFGNKQSALKRIICLAVSPPKTTVEKFYGTDELTLYVPRKSVTQYKYSDGWKWFDRIEPIEPPVVSGVNSAEISWVTNADASSYSLTLYLDAEHTRRLLTLTFDNRGYLQNMDINSDAYTQPQSMARHVRQLAEQQESEGFNSYLSFTVTGLHAGSDYYFVRRTYNALDEVIDEEQGSFTTLNDTGTAVGQNMSDDASNRKALHNGQLLIRRGDKTYDAQGREIK